MIIVSCMVSLSVQGQVSYKKLVDAGQKSYDEGKYYAAMRYFHDALDREDSDLDLWYKYGMAAKNQHAYERSRAAFAFIVEEAGSVENGDAIFQLAELSLLNEDYEKAAKYYKLYLKEFEGQDAKTDKRVDLGLRSAIWVQDQLDQPIRNVTHMGEEVNTPDSEHSPVFQDSVLNFASLQFGKSSGLKMSRILEKSKDESEAEVAKAVPNFNEAAYLTSDVSYSSDGELMFYTKCAYDQDENIICKIYYRHKAKGLYSLGVNASNSINSEGYTSTHPTVVEADGKRYVYFTSNRPGGSGGFDLWYSEFSDNMLFGAPVNVANLNTEYDEITPHYQKSTETLYYSSNGREGFGGYDVYKTNYTGKHSFSEIENMGMSVNSSYNDIHFFESEDGKEVYLSSNRKGSLYADNSFETCCYDIYQVDPKLCEIDVTALIFDKVDQSEIIGARLVITEKESGAVVFDKTLENSNATDVYLDCTKDYSVTASKDGYIPSTIDLSFADKGLELNGTKTEEKIFLEPAIVSLEVNIFDTETKEPLNGATIILVDSETGEEQTKSNPNGNDYVFNVKPGKKYMIKMTKPGYIPGEDMVSIGMGQKLVSKSVYLQKTPIEKKIVTLEEVLPIRLFFDNDQPNPKSMATSTEIMYEEAYVPYYAKKEKFKRNYGSKFRGDEKYAAEQRIDNFFENELKRNHDNMAKFTSTLLEVLQAGRTVNLFFRGFASPLSESEYNFNLGKRRVESMLLEFKRFNGGLFLPYIQSGQIILTERSFGESSAPAGVSDDFGDPSKSIFSPEASFERRVEIQEISVNRQ